MTWGDSCTDPPSPLAAQSPTHPVLYQLPKRDCPSLLKRVPVCPLSMCTLVPFSSTPHHAARGLFSYCPQSCPRHSLLLLGSPAPSPCLPRPPGCWPRPDTSFSLGPQAPTHTVLCKCFPSLVRPNNLLKAPSFSELFCSWRPPSKSGLVTHTP